MSPQLPTSTMRLGYVGLGNMGRPIFLNMVKHARSTGLPPPHGWNIDQSRYADIATQSDHIVLAEDLSKVVQESDVVFTCLLNDPVAQSVYTKLLDSDAARNVIFVDQSSLKPCTSVTLERQAKSMGAAYLAAPVFGRPDAAKAATLVQILAGDCQAKRAVENVILPSMARKIVDAGSDIGNGNALKLLGNGMILGIVELLAETHALVETIGFDSKVYQDFIDDFFPLYPFRAYGKNICSRSFGSPDGFRLEAGIKDARNMLALGEGRIPDFKMPTIELALKHLERAQILAGNDVDWSALAMAVREKADLKD